MKKYRVAIIGLGRIAWGMQQDWKTTAPRTHIHAWQTLEECVIVAGCDLEEEKCHAFAQEFPEASIYNDYEQMLKSEDIDLISICGWATQRAEMVLASINAGVRGIWCEKAMAVSLAECDKIGEAIEKSGTKISVAYSRRWAKDWIVVKELLDSEEIGQLESINVHFNGNMIHTGTHAFDMLHFLAGKVKNVAAELQITDNRVEESGYRFSEDTLIQDYSGFSVMEFESGVKAIIHGSTKKYFRFEFELLGTKGLIRIGNTQHELWQVGESSYIRGFNELKKQDFPSYNGSNPWVATARELLTSIKNQSATSCGWQEARYALAMALATHQSHFCHGKKIKLEEVDSTLVVENR
jgi:predicted dehydrogenase